MANQFDNLLSRIPLTVTTVLQAIEKLPAKIEAGMEAYDGFKTLLEAALSTFSEQDAQVIQDAYKAKMASTDEAHEETQEVLGELADEDEGAPLGGGVQEGDAD